MGRRQLRGRCATTENPAPALAHTGSAIQRPAALLHGPAHLIVYCNEPFLAEFGAGCLGLPAAEALLDLPRAAFELMDLVYGQGKPLARWVTMRGTSWRLTVAERRDVGTGEVYGIAMHLVPRASACDIERKLAFAVSGLAD